MTKNESLPLGDGKDRDAMLSDVPATSDIRSERFVRLWHRDDIITKRAYSQTFLDEKNKQGGLESQSFVVRWLIRLTRRRERRRRQAYKAVTRVGGGAVAVC